MWHSDDYLWPWTDTQEYRKVNAGGIFSRLENDYILFW